MNTDILKGKWRQFRGEARKAWGELSDNELDEIDGNMDKLVGKLQEKYGYAREKAQKEAETFFTKMEQNDR